MIVGEICQRSVDTVDMGISVRQAAQRMRQRSVGSLVAIEPNQKPGGIITDRDLVVRVIAEGKNPDSMSIDEVLTPSPVTVRESASVESALTIMAEESCRRLPVVNEAGELVGLISLDDILLRFRDQFNGVARLLEKESPQAPWRG